VNLYVAYHHYRAEGWVPKSGLKYGADMVLYNRGGPPSHHAQYAVIVQQMERDQTKSCLTWGVLNHGNRLVENVAKGLLLCYIVYPQSELDKIKDSPGCLPSFEVLEMAVKRWQPTRTRI